MGQGPVPTLRVAAVMERDRARLGRVGERHQEAGNFVFTDGRDRHVGQSERAPSRGMNPESRPLHQ
jgi:prepilin-type processing-associated H-X9-DG protein